MEFDNIDEILEILLCSDKSFDELENYCEKLFPSIKTLHKNSLGNKYPSKYTQCILECYKLKNNYTSCKWYSDKTVDKNIIKDNCKPIEFNRITLNGDVLKYVLYNEDLLNNSDNIDEANLDTTNKSTNENSSSNLPKFTNIKDAFMALDNVLKLYDKEVYCANFIAEVLEIKDKKVVVANEEFNLPLNNFLYAYSTKRSNIFYKNIGGIGYLAKNKENLKNIENLIDTPKEVETFSPDIDKNNLKIRRAILSCIKEFSAKYGKSGIAKILKGSKSIKDNIYNKAAASSSYYGAFEQLTLSFIEKEIDKLIDEEYLEIKKVNFGRPVLLASAKAESYINENIEEDFESKENDECYQNEDFLKIVNYIKEKANIFITGHAGTGKSYILNKLKEKYQDLVITSTTGIAAVNVKGQTLHSWAGVGICNHSIDYTVEKILSKSSIKNQIQKCKMLAIDEISMLNIATFEYVDKVLRIVRDCDEPFGGIQILLIGDFFQLPPVEKDTQKEQKYCFESPIWNELNLKNVILNKNYRQSEQNLITALSNMRTNNLTNDDIKLLKTREIKNDCNLENILHIYSTNEEADNYNNRMFAKIKEKEIILTSFDGIYRGSKLVDSAQTDREQKLLDRIDVTCRAEKNIILKIGARVMLLVNLDFEKGLINGSCGIVKDICEDYVSVLFDNGKEFKIKQHDFEFYNNNQIIALRRQYPLRLAYGITIHKSQGMSLDNLVVDCSRIFEKGQTYVAISRIKKLSGLYLNNFNPANVMVDNKVAEFYKNLS